MLDELKLRYKETSLAKRMVLCAFVALLPAILLYIEESAVIDEEFDAAETAEKAAAANLLQADNQLKNLQKTESELEFTREQLKKAETRLPDNIIIDEVLRTIGKTAKEASINVRLFEPGQEAIRGDEYKFVELPIKISVDSREYSQLCEWVDSVAGLKSKMYLKSWSITRRSQKTIDDFSTMPVAGAAPQSLTPSMMAEQEGRKARENLRLTLEAEFSLFKLASASQIAAAEAAIKPEKGQKPDDHSKPAKDGEGKKPENHSDSGLAPADLVKGGRG